MSFTDTQRTQIRLYLGYPDAFRYKNTRLESMINDGALSPEAEASVIEDLANVAIVEAKLLTTGLSMAGLKAVDEIHFYENKGWKEIRAYGKMYVGRISITLGVPIYSDVFGTSGYLGDQYSAGGLGTRDNGRGGNFSPLG